MKALLFFAGTVVTFAAEPALTIYNQNFAVVRETFPIDLKAGDNDTAFSGATALVEPHTVILRDPAGKTAFTILNQSYRNDPVSQDLLLSLFEGRTIKFLAQREGRELAVEGKIVRAGNSAALEMYRQQYTYGRQEYGAAPGQPLIEMNGELRFGLPGQPVFPALADDTVLKPTLTWKIHAEQAAKFDAELAYLSNGFGWIADYNVIAGEKGDEVEVAGWVTVDNHSGTTFRDARVRLMAGNVNRLVQQRDGAMALLSVASSTPEGKARGPRVSEKTFDEYHLYTLADPVTLRDRETKQVEFVRARGIKAQNLYIYDGASLPNLRDSGYGGTDMLRSPGYGTESSRTVWVMREFRNNEANHLGMPLPRGRIRFYRRDGQQLEFTGENLIEHTAKDELIRLYTGDAFDLTGERIRTDFTSDSNNHRAEEAFTIRLRNQKKEQVEVRVVEHLYRGGSWEVKEKSNAFVKTDASTIEFRVQVKPGEEKAVTYKVHYTW